MKRFPIRTFSRPIRAAALAAILVNGSIVLLQGYASSTIGYGGIVPLVFVPLLSIPLFLAVLSVPVLLCLLPFRRVRREGAMFLQWSLVYILIGLPLVGMSHTARMSGFKRLEDRGKPLVAAIHKFVEDHERPPATLQDLVPNYLPEVPGTGMPSYPEYQYSTAPDQWDGNPWVVYVMCSSGFMNFDKFMYLPRQNYPRTGYGGALERVGEWAYVHE